jgi:hypothetical protein
MAEVFCLQQKLGKGRVGEEIAVIADIARDRETKRLDHKGHEGTQQMMASPGLNCVSSLEC